MNEIILAPCDVISKIKQNSSDMNEIILAPCDAGYVQSCTGFESNSYQIFYRILTTNPINNIINVWSGMSSYIIFTLSSLQGQPWSRDPGLGFNYFWSYYSSPKII
jgi:hypothetical protein